MLTESDVAMALPLIVFDELAVTSTSYPYVVTVASLMNASTSGFTVFVDSETPTDRPNRPMDRAPVPSVALIDAVFVAENQDGPPVRLDGAPAVNIGVDLAPDRVLRRGAVAAGRESPKGSPG